MKFSCITKNLEHSLSIVERFTGKNMTLPILGTVLCEARDHAITISGTNLEYAIELKIPGKIIHTGKISIPAKTLLQLLQSINDEKIDIEEKQGNFIITTETRHTRINGMRADDFPLIPVLKKTGTVVIESIVLAHGIEKVLSSVSTSEFKPELSGVFFNVSLGTISLASTDTFRLSEKKIQIEKKQNNHIFSFILPYKVAQEVYRIYSERDEEPVHISIGDGQVVFESEGVQLVSRCIEGAFPEYSTIIPKSFDTSFFINRNEFMSAVRSTSIFASKIQDTTLTFQKKELHLTSQNTDIGEQTITLPISLTGKEVSVSFNYRYLLDGISVLDEEEIFIGVNQENNPALLKNKSDGSFLYVVMPIKV